MSDFYGWLKGNKGVTTRGGTKRSGVTATLQSESNRAIVTMAEGEGGSDHIDLVVGRHDISSRKRLVVVINGHTLPDAWFD